MKTETTRHFATFSPDSPQNITRRNLLRGVVLGSFVLATYGLTVVSEEAQKNNLQLKTFDKLVLPMTVEIPTDVNLRFSPKVPGKDELSNIAIPAATHPRLKVENGILIPPPKNYEGKPEDNSWLGFFYKNELLYAFYSVLSLPENKTAPIRAKLSSTPNELILSNGEKKTMKVEEVK